MKEEVIWLEEFDRFSEAQQKIGPWMEQGDNQAYPHSALGTRSPVAFETLVAYEAKATGRTTNCTTLTKGRVIARSEATWQSLTH